MTSLHFGRCFCLPVVLVLCLRPVLASLFGAFTLDSVEPTTVAITDDSSSGETSGILKPLFSSSPPDPLSSTTSFATESPTVSAILLPPTVTSLSIPSESTALQSLSGAKSISSSVNVSHDSAPGRTDNVQRTGHRYHCQQSSGVRRT